MPFAQKIVRAFWLRDGEQTSKSVGCRELDQPFWHTNQRMSHPPPRRDGLLRWIIAFKAFKAVTLTALGIALVSARHSDAVQVLVRLAIAVHLPLTSRLFQRLVRSAGNLTTTKETALALTAFGYAVLMGTEGLTLHLRKPWARWFTIIATSSLIPLEMYEIVREIHAIRVLVLVANIGIVVYLWQRKEMFE
jgi:uncharacterized membrane protein (DUF2068 family)